jgi:hypothetical protein
MVAFDRRRHHPGEGALERIARRSMGLLRASASGDRWPRNAWSEAHLALEEAHAASQAALRMLDAAVSVTSDLAEAERLRLERVKAERRRRLLRERLLSLRLPMSHLDAEEILVSHLTGARVRLGSVSPEAVGNAVRERELQAYRRLEAAAARVGDDGLARLARQVVGEASGRQFAWLPRG